MPNAPYPPSPKINNYSFLEPSATFKDHVYAMIFGIAMFIFLYIALIIIGIVLLVSSGYAGIGLISLHPSLLTLAAGLGLIAFGVMFFLFLIKFIFSRTDESDPMQIEIHRQDHPELFVFIKQITLEVKTDFPKRIFITPDVNAAVFYNSSFWSMFLPIRKNLKIGLGLVNSLNISEFKAALAHEFGHFSQRSTTFGSYIYTMNKLIFNLVHQHDRWDRILEGWASAGGIFGFFAGITFWLVQKVRALLTYAYQKLNVRYMALSREMEYHADLVACSVAGNEPLIQTLRKLEFTDLAYNYAIQSLNEKIGQQKKAGNLYKMHSMVVEKMADQYHLTLHEGMPIISDSVLEKHLIKSRVNVKDQWASHPPREDREANANTVNLPVQTIDTSA